MQIVALAYEQLRNFELHKKGYYEGPGNCNPYGPCGQWCAMFSTWVWESLALVETRALGEAATNVVGSFAAGLLVAAAGLGLALL